MEQMHQRMNRAAGRHWRGAAVVLLGLLLALGVAVAAAQDQPQGLIIERSVQPESGLLGEAEFTVQMTFSGVPGICPATTVSRPSDIVLVIDRSSSMEEETSNGATKLDLLKQATQTFVRQVNLATDRVAIVQFDAASNVVQGLTNDLTALDAAIDSVELGGGTSIDTGVIQAVRELQLNGSDGATPVIVLFTDGEHGGDPDDPIDRAEDARDAGVRIITVGLGQPGDIDPDMLTRMASGPGDVYLIDNPNDLNQAYQTIAQSVVNQPASATDVIVTHQFNASAFELVEGSVRPATAVVNINTISLPITQVLEAPVTLSYRVRPLTPGTNNITTSDVVNYNLCGQTPQQITLPTGLAVAVQAPTPTPTDTPSPTPTVAPTPTLAPTPGPTWTPTPPPSAAEAGRRRAAALLCDTGWLNWLFLLLLALFLLWWLWRVWRAAHEDADADEDRRGCICRLCRFIPWLAVPLTLLLLWAFLRQVDLCPIRESLYFWRIEGGQSNGEIYVTDPQGFRPAEEFAPISQGTQCVGCHAVSSNARRIAAIADSGVGRVVVYDLDGEAIDIPQLAGSYVNWSPDGRLLAVADSNGDIQILDVDSGQVSPLAGASDPAIFETMPAWSADGQTIAYVRGANGDSVYAVTDGADIYVVPAAGGAAAPLPGASGDGFNYYPAYSPDGRWLAFTRHTTGTTTYAAPEAEIYLVPAGGGAAQRLAANDGVNNAPLSNVSNSWPTWSLDGSMLAFTSKRDDPGYDLFLTTIDAEGNSGGAQPVAGASEPGIFEHLPFWGLRPEASLLAALLSLWPFLLGYLLLALLYWLCRRLCPGDREPVPPPVEPALPPEPLPPLQLDPLWQVAPTLLVGVGGTGRWVLTHLKKSLADGGFGRLPDNVRFALLDTSERETTNVYHDAAGRQAGVSFAGATLEPGEVLLMGPNLSGVIGRANDAALRGWFPHDDYSGLAETDRDLAQGTRRRRPMARAGLIQKLREGAAATDTPVDAARLWRFLLESSGAVIQKRDATTPNDLVRVVLVGSMAGGMSGVLSDLAFLLRGAAQEALGAGGGGTVHLEGYFTTNGPFSRLVENPSTLQINTVATARELQRFQLSAGLPSLFDYTAAATPPADAAAAHLRRSHTTKPFDEIVLFGGAGRYDVERGKSTEPWATTLASMADVLALRLDRATAAGTAGDHRAETRRDAETQQTERGQAVVSAAGSYTLRLPLVDMLHIVHTRWARKLYQVFLMGDQESATLSFDPNDAGLSQTPGTMAQEFLLGRIQSAPPGIAVAGNLTFGGPISSRAVARLVDEANDDSFRVYLGEAIGLILNGTLAENRLQRRAPQLGYATVFTEEVGRLLGQAAEQAAARATSAPTQTATGLLARIRAFFDLGEPSANDWTDAARQLTSWSAMAQNSHASLRDVRRLMGDDTKDEAGKPVVPGLYAELNRRQADAEARRAQMDQVAVRRYLWSRPVNPDRDPADPANQQDLVAEWTTAALEQLKPYLNRFYWHTEQDGTVRLSLVTYHGQRQIRLDDRRPETVQALADELINLAANITREIAANVRLATVLPTQLSSRSNTPEADLIGQAWQVAQPSIAGALAPGMALADHRSSAVAGIPEHVRRDPKLKGLDETLTQLDRRLPNQLEPVNATVIGATDATSLTLVRSYDLMPLFTLPELTAGWQMYARNAGREQARLAESPRLATVFAAERAALDYESRLEYAELLNQDFRQLHPLVVHALQRPEIVEAFALGVAAGWITVNNREVHLQLPGRGDMLLPGAARYRPLLAALLEAVGTWDDTTPAWQALRAALQNPPATTRAAWQQFIAAVRQVAPEPVAPAAPQTVCLNGHPMEPGKKFCGKCGQPAAPAPAAAGQPVCLNGHPMEPGKKFCGKCGQPAAPAAPAAPPVAPAARAPRPFAGEPAEVQDIVAIATLAAYRQLAGPEAWERIVMSRARRAG